MILRLNENGEIERLNRPSLSLRDKQKITARVKNHFLVLPEVAESEKESIEVEPVIQEVVEPEKESIEVEVMMQEEKIKCGICGETTVLKSGENCLSCNQKQEAQSILQAEEAHRRVLVVGLLVALFILVFFLIRIGGNLW